MNSKGLYEDMKYLESETQNKSSLILILSLFISILFGVLYSLTNSSAFGFISTFVICLALTQLDTNDCFLLLFVTQFLRSVIRINIGSASYSFLLFAYPIVFLRFHIISNDKSFYKVSLAAIFLLFYDIIISTLYDVANIGDIILWALSLVLILQVLYSDYAIDINKLIISLGIAIWCICIINILAEIRIFGSSLNPSLYGAYLASDGSYYSFGKGYPAIAGGNEIAQYIPLFIGTSILNWKNFNKFSKGFLFTSDIFFAYIGMICIARAFYIEMAIFFIAWFIIKAKRPISFLFFLVILIIIGYICIYTFSDYLNPLIMQVQRRFAQGNGGRDSLWIRSFEVLADWKVGLFGAGSYYPLVFTDLTAHNIFLDTFLSFGFIIGTFYLFTLLRTIVDECVKYKLNRFKYWIPFIMLFVYKNISGSVRDVPFYYIIAFIILFMIGMKQEDVASDCL